MNDGDECYYYEEIQLNRNRDVGIITDVAIVLMMRKTSDYVRRNFEQIKERVPTKRLIVQYNKGFRDCDKPRLVEQSSNYDICDANHVALKYAFNQLGLTHVLVLEDDAYFLPNIKSDIAEIKTFINTRRFDIYNLGPVIYATNPFMLLTSGKHINTWMYGGAHACVYHRRFLSNFEYSKCKHIDRYSVYLKHTYMYHYPICMQHFRSNSSNRMKWHFYIRSLFIIAHALGFFREYPPKLTDYMIIRAVINWIHLFVLITLCYVLVSNACSLTIK